MFGKVLIANRGEIACRVIRSCRARGLRTVAVVSAADRHALHARLADEAVEIGAAPPRESYLDIERIIAAAKATGAQAVHPGYGFLSENAAFAKACAQAGLVFIGPPAEAIRLMGNKAEAKRRMREAGVPCIPGYDGTDQSDATLIREAEKIGLPLMIKAAAGGGGRGMRRVAELKELPAALASARSEAQSAFGSGELILEYALTAPRHVEVQVFADTQGNVIHLGERDCSIQRRHQKVIEEAPSPAVFAELRARMGEAAVRAAKAIGYVGAGTIEFLLAEGDFVFMEMNTRLQVEHPVTELVTGLDLVDLQLRVAAGESLPLSQADVRLDGHAIEARLYAENPDAGFIPQTGTLLRWQAPASVRVDAGVDSGTEITSHYDPLLAKIIAHGKTREEARQKLVAALRDTTALGVTTNKAFLAGCLEHPEFFAGRATTDFIAAHFAPQADADPRSELLAAAALIFAQTAAARLPQPELAFWRSSGAATAHFTLGLGNRAVSLGLTFVGNNRFEAAVGDIRNEIELLDATGDAWRICFAGLQLAVRHAFDTEGRLHLDVDGAQAVVTDLTMQPAQSRESASSSGRLTPPMNGRVVAVLAAAGATVKRGQGLIVLESMKMEHTLAAPCDGVLAELTCAVGEQVAPGKLLARVEAA
ncbi:MAG: 3-methylcrotonyl-CoA carboxylase [Rhodocyclaceae bacterium]|nr:3-methylcrotonyl-CoA carboxylase [Rhodocyclaceae bacterium]HNQ56165.1 biotin carboxylase N-terminal domain-containing protein [Candidatus Desulfobacillus denitrificans]HNT63257.1 biotin carboxylase N-terminal domain-containing protein [Candidatus Desulfobacillus denitrificans]